MIQHAFGLEVRRIVSSGPGGDQGKIDVPGTMGTGPRGSRGPGEATKNCPSLSHNTYYLLGTRRQSGLFGGVRV